METRERFFWGMMAVMLVTLFLLSLLGIGSRDLSARQNEQRRRLGAIYMTLNNPFYEIVDEEIRTAVEARGDVLITRDPALSVERQLAEVDELIASGVELIFINPVDYQRLGPALERARAAGVPVIAIDTSVEDASLVAATIVSDNYQAGEQCADHLIATRAGGRVAILSHAQTRSGVDRIAGFRARLASHPEFAIVAEEDSRGQLEIAMPAMLTMLAARPDIDVVMALNDPSAMGAMAALESAGRLAGVAVYGVDGAPETKDMIAAGLMTATAGQSPREIGRRAAETAYKILNHEDYEREIVLPTRLITRENIGAVARGEWD